MKVYIGPYKSWFNVYRITQSIPFISEDTAEKFGDWLLNNTKLQSVFDYINERRDRTIKVRIDSYDTWSMDNTLAHIILPMLKQLKETKHGSPMVCEEDVPPHMRHTFRKGEDDYETDDPWVHYKWDWVLNEMIWTFEQELDDNAKDKFFHGDPKIVWEDIEGTELTEMKQTNPDYWVDHDGLKQYENRIQNGFRLFGKYYQSLWD